MRMRRIMVAALATAIVVGAAGCGGEERLTRAEFTKQAQAACGRAMTEFFASARKANAEEMSRAEQEAFAVKALRTAADNQAEVLDAILPPEELQDAYADYRGTVATRIELQIQQIEEQGLEGGGDADSSAARQAAAQTRKAARLARQLGLKRCG